jgi:hypothetical protein
VWNTRLAAGPGLTLEFAGRAGDELFDPGVNREFTNHSQLGFMATSTNRSLPDELASLPGSA